MKVIITAQGELITDKVDPRFGRTSFFIRFNTEAKDCDVFDNKQQFETTQGAGLQAAKQVADMQADVVITGHVGPKAFAALKMSGIKIFRHSKEKTVKETMALFKQGELEEIMNSDVESHWV